MGKKLLPIHGKRIKYSVIGLVLGLLLTAMTTACNVQNPPIESYETFPQTTAMPDSSSGSVVSTPAVSENKEIIFKDVNFRNAVTQALGKKDFESILVSDVQQLTSFSARVCGIADISEIIYFTNLESLDLKGNRITDLTPLGSLTKLKKLDISKNFTLLSGDREKGLNLAPIKNLVLLEELNASGNMITDISPLAGLACLRVLDVQNNRLTDLSALATCTGIESLNIASNYHLDATGLQEEGIADLRFVGNMSDLHTLIASNNVIATLEGVEQLSKLKYVDITQNYVMSLEPLAGCANLQTLLAENNNLLDLKALENHAALEVLNVRINRIHYVPEILTMPALKEFQYEGNQILDYRPIDQFEQEVANRAEG
ncbi:MAG: leucine-rich repeat domain-containing protein [Clostridia bacterium]|nr:leucine-rich repeat domain-containing protein [Clostridia bacterium]